MVQRDPVINILIPTSTLLIVVIALLLLAAQSQRTESRGLQTPIPGHVRELGGDGTVSASCQGLLLVDARSVTQSGKKKAAQSLPRHI